MGALRSVIAVVAGLAVAIAVVIGGEMTLKTAGEAILGHAAFDIVVSAVAGLSAGVVVAIVAPGARMLHAVVLGVIVVTMNFFQTDVGEPVSSYLPGLAVLFAGLLLGAWLWRR
ncbi:MAG: hypothetical protein JOZ72_09460 [Alphaproteobacteria bacterium]|nr:hypothetical protein [Alphaproteobacteria bacterium]